MERHSYQLLSATLQDMCRQWNQYGPLAWIGQNWYLTWDCSPRHKQKFLPGNQDRSLVMHWSELAVQSHTSSDLTVIVYWQCAEQHSSVLFDPCWKGIHWLTEKTPVVELKTLFCVCVVNQTLECSMASARAAGSKGHITREQRHLTTSLPLVWAQQTVWWCSGRHKQQTYRWTNFRQRSKEKETGGWPGQLETQ